MIATGERERKRAVPEEETEFSRELFGRHFVGVSSTERTNGEQVKLM